MRTIIKEKMLYTGILIFVITLLIQHLVAGETFLIDFFKGFSSGIILIGALVSIINIKKTKPTILLCLLVITSYSAYGQTGTSKTGSLLWKISGKDLTKPSYLLGTLHLKSGEYLDSIPGATTALYSCEQVVGELDMSNMLALQMQMQQAMMMTPDTTYKMLYSDEDYRFANEKIISLMGAGLDQVGMMKPAAIQLAIIALAYTKYFPEINPANILDTRIQAEAVKAQKPVLALETVDDQLYILFGVMNLQRQADALLCSLKNLDQLFALIPEQIDNYNQANLTGLYQLLENNEICPSTDQETDALNKDRNNAWMLKLPDIMKEKSSFIAVGVLHLAGEEGLLYLLEQVGYQVEIHH